MQVTIDSNEPLADALRVIGSVYDVTLTTADGGPAVADPPRGSKRVTSTPVATAKGRRTRSARAAASNGGAVDPKVVRQWASENGHQVNARGSLSAAVRDAYRAAHPS